MKHLIGTSANGIAVYIDLIHSSAVKDISHQPHLLTLAAEALPKLTIDRLHAAIEHDMGRPIGYDLVIPTTDDEAVFYVRLLRESTYTRFTKKGNPIATSYITLVLTPNEDGVSCDVHTIWVGRSRPPQPGTSEETDQSVPFWKTHAIIFQNQPVQTQTMTRTCPY